MFYNENEVHYLVNLRKAEIERVSRSAWKRQGLKKMNLFQILAASWMHREKPAAGCHCQHQSIH